MTMKRRWIRPLAGLFSLTLLAAACGDDDDEAGTEDTTEETSDSRPKSDALALGVLFPESGSLSAIIGALRTPVDLAMTEINAAGGVLGKPVTIAAADDGTDDANLASAGLESLVSSNGINVLLGPASSDLTEALMDEIRDADVVACSGSNTAASLEELDDGGRYFGFAPNDALQGPALAEVISGDGHQSVGILARNDTYGTGFAEALSTALEEAGVEVPFDETFDPNSATGYQADIQSLVDADVDAVAILGFQDDGGKVVAQMIESGVGPGDFPVYTADGMQGSTFWQKVGATPDLVEGIKGTAPAAAPEGVDHPFAAAYAATGQDTIFSAYYYDCTMVAALAAEAAGSVDADEVAEAIPDVVSGGTTCQTFVDCKALLDDGEDIDYSGASGELDLNEAGHVTRGAYDVWQYDAEGAVQTLDVPQVVIDREE
jgi:ABC-type branched-subunit amino acid transport system substrate-binding protein